MTALLLEDPAHDLLRALRGVDGVATAALEPDPADLAGPGLLRLELAPGAVEVAVATRVGHLLRRQFDLSVDTGSLTLMESFGAQPGRGPLRSTRTTITSAGTRVQVSATVSAGGASHDGTADGPMTATGTLRAVAAGVLDAASGLADLGGVAISSVTGPDAAGSEVVVVLDGPAGPVEGRSAVDGDARQAAVRAVLDAVRQLLPA